MKYIRGIKKRVFKKTIKNIFLDGIGYSVKQYNLLIDEMSKYKVGDVVWNPYKSIYENIKQINSRWEKYWHNSKIRIFKIDFITETGYIIYDIFDDPEVRKKFPIIKGMSS